MRCQPLGGVDPHPNWQDIGMVDPEGVIEPVHAVVLLQQPFIGDAQEADVLLINATIPDVIQDGHLLKL